MKQEIKQRLKYYSKIGQYIVISLCWLMALIGISAYSVYWLRQNANYEQEALKHDLKPRLASLDTTSNKSFYRVSSELGVYDNIIDSSHYDNYGWLLNYDGFTDSYDYALEITDVTIDNVTYNYLYYTFYKFTIPESHGLRDISLYSIAFWTTGHYHRLSLYDFDNQVISIADSNIYYFAPISFVPAWGSQIITSAYDGALFYSTFNEVFNPNTDVVDFVLSSGFNPHLLITSEIIEHNLISPVNYNSMPYETAFSIGFDFVANGEYYNGINIGLQVLPYIYDETFGTRFELTTPPYLMHFTYIYYFRYDTGNMPTDCPLADNKSGTDANGVYWRFVGYAGAQSKGNIGGNIVYVRKSFGIDWVSDAYRYLLIKQSQYESTSYLMGYNARDDSAQYIFNEGYNDGLTLGDVLNRSINNVDYFLPISLGGGNTDVGLGSSFALLSTAFSSLIPLLNIQIIPGITLGLLAFIPLIVTILLVILKLVKK